MPNSYTSKIQLTKEEFVELYHVQDKTFYEIAKIAGCAYNSLSYFMKRHGIEKKKELKEILDAKTLVELYKEYSIAKIAKMYNCTTTSIIRLMRIYGIKATDTHNKKPKTKPNPNTIRVVRSRKNKNREQVKCSLTKDILLDLYRNQLHSIEDIANMYDCSYKMISAILDDYNIPKRSNSDTSKMGYEFESLVNEIFDALNLPYKKQYRGIKGIKPDFYDEETNTILDAKINSSTPFQRNNGKFFRDYSCAGADKVVILYLIGKQVNAIGNFEWRHISYYYDALISIGREDIIDKLNETEKRRRSLL